MKGHFLKTPLVLIAAILALAITLAPPVTAQNPFRLFGSASTGAAEPVTATSGRLHTVLESEKAEDAAHTTADKGLALLGVRKDDATQTTGADADYAGLALDAYSAAFVRQDHPNRVRCTVTVSTATALTAVGGSCAAPGAGLSLYVTDILFTASAAGIAADAHPTLKYGTGGTCGTGTTVFWQALTAAAIVVQDNRSMPIKIPANNELCWISSTAGSKAIVIGGFIAP